LGGEATGAASAEVRALQLQVAELQRLVGKKEEQIEFLKKTARHWEQQNAVKPSLQSGERSRHKQDAR
jgi:predicted nucleic acid-binding Zn ribbon protein